MDKTRALLAKEFGRLAGRYGTQHHLDLRGLVDLSHSQAVHIPVDLTHLSVLWCLDRRHSGRVSLEDLNALLDLCAARKRLGADFERQLQGYCTLQLWRALSAEDGQQHFADWVCALLLEASPQRRQFRRRHQYVGLDAAQLLHRLLRVQEGLGLDYQAFVDLLQRCGEEARLLDLEDEAQDDWVPLEVVRQFAGAVHGGVGRLMRDILPGGMPS